MTRHPSDESLLSFCETEDDPVGGEVQRHLESGCKRCQERIMAMHQVLSALHAAPLRRAPRAWVRDALERINGLDRPASSPGIFETAKAKIERYLEEIKLGLVLDTAAGALMPGIRGAATTESRQLLYESPQGTLHVQIDAGAAGKATVTGQFLSAGEQGKPPRGIAILDRDRKPLRCRMSELGEFRFAGVAPGSVRLRVEWGDRVLVTDPIDLGAGADG